MNSPADSSLPTDLREQLLERLGFSTTPDPNPETLRHLYDAWCRNIPFDNLRKLLHLRSGTEGSLPGATPADFFKSWIQYGTGGTCWTNAAAMHALLTSLGFGPGDRVALLMPNSVEFCCLFYGAAKIGAEGNRGREIISLVPARTDTAWWQKGIVPALWCAWEGRMTFLEPIETLEARHADRVNRAKALGLKPPKPLRYERVGNLARGETATFPSALCYTGPRPERFRLIFGRYGRIYHELTAPQALRLGLIH